MYLRKYQTTDCPQLTQLFFNTVHTVNSKDYTPEKLDAWATGHVDEQQWNRSFIEHFTVVAVEGDTIVGFGDIDETGYLDRLYVHSMYQRRGIATAICDMLEGQAGSRIVTHSSITALPFFKSRGYRVVRQQQVERNGVVLDNFVMEKLKQTV